MTTRVSYTYVAVKPSLTLSSVAHGKAAFHHSGMKMEEHLKKEMGRRIRERATALGLTQEAIAEKFNIERESVQQWWAGKTSPRGHRLGKLAETLKCSVEWLLVKDGALERPALTAEEENRLDRLRQLSAESLHMIDDLIDRALARLPAEIAVDPPARKKGRG